MDADGDGVADCVDGCPNDPNKIDPGICGCGVPDTDTDADGVADCNDLCPGTPAGAPVDANGCPLEACCFPTGSCLDLAMADCQTAGGLPSGAGTSCGGTVCPFGACCFPDGTCGDNILDADCVAAGGTFQGSGVLCAGVSCPPPTGACCLPGGGCLVLTEGDCNVIPAATRWVAPLTDCTDADMNGQADACEAHGDIDGDGVVDPLPLVFTFTAMPSGLSSAMHEPPSALLPCLASSTASSVGSPYMTGTTLDKQHSGEVGLPRFPDIVRPLDHAGFDQSQSLTFSRMPPCPLRGASVWKVFSTPCAVRSDSLSPPM